MNFSLNNLVALKVKLDLDLFSFLHYGLCHTDEDSCTKGNKNNSMGGCGKDENMHFPDEERGKKEHLAFPEDSSWEGTGPDHVAL